MLALIAAHTRESCLATTSNHATHHTDQIHKRGFPQIRAASADRVTGRAVEPGQFWPEGRSSDVDRTCHWLLTAGAGHDSQRRRRNERSGRQANSGRRSRICCFRAGALAKAGVVVLVTVLVRGTRVQLCHDPLSPFLIVTPQGVSFGWLLTQLSGPEVLLRAVRPQRPYPVAPLCVKVTAGV
jgi:hypothetical protein